MSKDKLPTALETREIGQDQRLFSPSAARNQMAISEVFSQYMPKRGSILEIASGTGEHAYRILSDLPELHWKASEYDESLHGSINAWMAYKEIGDRFLGVTRFDAASEDWQLDDAGAFDGILCCNMIHISPWQAGEGVLTGASRHLREGGRLMLYGPFMRNGEHTSESNRDFDISLKSRHADWGVRDLDLLVVPAAQCAGLELVTVVDMPANNLSVIFQKI